MELSDVLAPATLARLQRAQDGHDVARRLRIAALVPGDVGVLSAEVIQVAPPRTFRRKNGTEGLIGRVTLSDGTGEVDLVLWGGENQHTRDGTLRPGGRVVLHGVAAKHGFRGGMELSLGAARIEAATAAPSVQLVGTLVGLEPTTIVDGRFQCQATLDVDGRRLGLVAWDGSVKALVEAGVGAQLALDAVPHPMLDDVLWLHDGAVRAATEGPC